MKGTTILGAIIAMLVIVGISGVALSSLASSDSVDDEIDDEMNEEEDENEIELEDESENSNPGKMMLILTAAGDDTDAYGLADIKSVHKGPFEKVSIKVKVSELNDEEGYVYEGWLVDADSGYWLSLGGFQTDSKGSGKLEFKQALVNYGIYDMLVITKDLEADPDPNAGDAVLGAAIPEASVEMKAALSGDSEVPPVETEATGTGVFFVDTDANRLSYIVKYKDLEGTETGAHIHGFAAAGVNAGVLHPLALGSTKVGVWDYAQGQEADILAGLAYVNVHSDLHPSGEIRGQILPA